MTSKGHRGFTGAAARISSKAGGSFEAWDGYIHGMNVELEPGRKIVQRWRPSEADWPEEYFSTVRILLAPTANGTRLTFTQTGVLSQHAGHLAEGWKEHYWEMLKAYFSEPQAPAPS